MPLQNPYAASMTGQQPPAPPQDTDLAGPAAPQPRPQPQPAQGQPSAQPSLPARAVREAGGLGGKMI
jgi:hypothetical protein